MQTSDNTTYTLQAIARALQDIATGGHNVIYMMETLAEMPKILTKRRR
uniref:Uncharacterized protein n=1 Tax=Candidatus Methanogaster sp. ANME-2c ERB4 TaxID=2759911 RepID=A0A7G9YPI6_9EURY|nr:hypothetical protein GKKIKBAN_00034 [Methanosarcinales archaeon ANME-2c ERB4]